MKKKDDCKDSPSEIVINCMFSGEYLIDKLGHEVINMFKSDDDNYYLYLNPHGSFDKNHARKIKKMVMVRFTSYKGCVEVIGLADGLTDIPAESQDELIKGVSYGGVTLEQLFNKTEEKQDCFISFSAAKVWRPNAPTYLVFDGGKKELLDDKTSKRVFCLNSKQGTTPLKQYFSSLGKTAGDYQELERLFSQEKNRELMPKVNIEELKCPIGKNFFEACGIDNSELAFSNMFAYILEKYPDVLHGFTSHQKIDCSKLSVKRESEGNIDIFVKTPSHIVAIENKVLSDINGKKKGEESIESQLKNYYNYVDGEKGMYKTDPREKLFILLTPDHNNIDLSKYECGDKYIKVHYSKLRDYLDKYSNDNHLQNDMYLQELIKAMDRHCQIFNNELYDQTKRRFYQRLRDKRVIGG